MYDRRTFLRRAGLATAGTALLAGLPRPAAAQDAELAPFLHGVASGDPLPDGVVIWTRVTPADGAPTEVTWRIALDADLVQVVRQGSLTTDASRDHTAKVDVRGLEANRWYFFEFEALGARSIVGRTRTAPAGAVESLRFGVVSCSNFQGGFFNAYARLAERNDLDAVVHLGDYLYEYGNGDDRYGPGTGELASARDHQPPTEMVSLADYRLRHANYKLDPDLRRLHQLYPWIVTWDDHESTNNSHRDGAQNHQAEEGDWSARKAAAQQAYAEWMPIRVADPAKIYRSLRFGDLLDLIVMDTRLEGRDREVGSTGSTILSGAEIDDPARQMISAAQRTMVFDALSRPGATWKVVAQQVILGQWNGGGAPALPALPDQPIFKPRTGGNALNPDQWDGYTAERDRLFSHIRSAGVDNVVVLTGDVHTSWALDLTEEPLRPPRLQPGDG
jgi:alkaline phosphatase D